MCEKVMRQGFLEVTWIPKEGKYRASTNYLGDKISKQYKTFDGLLEGIISHFFESEQIPPRPYKLELFQVERHPNSKQSKVLKKMVELYSKVLMMKDIVE
jgi:hypothetical protein